MSSKNDIEDTSFVIAIDFGTTFSGFAFAKKVKPDEINPLNIHLNNIWSGKRGLPKTNTALLYFGEPAKLNLKWGEKALTYTPPKSTKNETNETNEPYHIIERFKLLLDKDAEDDNIPDLPDGLDVKTVITDYFTKMKGVIEGTLRKRCNGIPLSQVLFVLSVPAEWSPRTRNILRNCIYEAGLLRESEHHKLEFTTEPEAAAIHCLMSSDENYLSVGDTYLVVDCGGGTVDLTIRTLLPDRTLGEETPRSGYPCGSTFVDREFEKYLSRVVGFKAMEDFKKNNYGDLQELIYDFFCPEIKFPFGDNSDVFESIVLDLEKVCPALIQHITGETREKLISKSWVIVIKFEDVMRMFDKTVDKIIDLINEQLGSLTEQQKVTTMFLVGGFSESSYLFNRIYSIFKERIPKITIPREPIAAVVKGACYYGLNKSIIKKRALKWSYGIEVNCEYKSSDDPKYKTGNNRILKFDVLAYKGERLKVNEERRNEYKPLRRNQPVVTFKILYSDLPDPKYQKQDGVKELGNLTVNLPLKSYGTNQDYIIEFFLKFAEEELKVTARNKETKKELKNITLEYPPDY